MLHAYPRAGQGMTAELKLSSLAFFVRNDLETARIPPFY